MRGFGRALTIFVGTAVSLVGLADTPGGAELKNQLTTIARASAPTHMPPPLAGIKLLDEIFQHLHSLPQLAFKQKPMYQTQAQQALIAQGPTDPYLAIKPQAALEKSKIAMAMPRKEAYYDAFDSKSSDKDARPISRSYNTNKNEGKSDFRRDATVAQTEIASPSGYHIAAAPPPASEPAADEERAGMRNLSRAAKSLYGITNTISNAQQAADRLASAYTTPAPATKQAATRKKAQLSNMRNANLIADDDLVRNTPAQGTPVRGALLRRSVPMAPQSRQISQSPMITEYVPGDSGYSNSAATNGTLQETAFNDSPAELQIAPGAGGAVGGTVTIDQPTKLRTMREYDSLKSQKTRALGGKALNEKALSVVAMNVPNVITGTPTCRLGTSAGEAVQALAASFDIKEEKVEGYTVCSGLRRHAQDCAVQLYIKHGMIEALRIFDHSLMPADLGVSLGDALPSVKSRFGEPAFMISEPASGDKLATTGQNYVYPISQVCFQLARTGKSSPRVVSVLIFNMK